MAGNGSYSIEILDRSTVSPPPDTARTTSVVVIPLSFFDIPWIPCSPMQRVLFYDLPQARCSIENFTETTLPSLKRSLALALRRFFPLAGALACPPPPGKPHILCSDDDSVPFIVAVSASADFDELTSDVPQAAPLLHPLLPSLPPSYVKNGTHLAPLFAVQVTLFPNSGVSIGVQFKHVVADGKAFIHFKNTWASICREDLGGVVVDTASDCIAKSAPHLDRSVVKDENGLELVFLEKMRNMASASKENSASPRPSLYADKLRATFTLSRSLIDQLKSWILDRARELSQVSTFVATCAYTWTCLVKSSEIEIKAKFPSLDVCHFGFTADCRGRLGYLIPETYFGNCLSLSCFAIVKTEELMGPGGTVAAARAIGEKVKELGSEGGPLLQAERWLSNYKTYSESGWLVSVAGSTRHRDYQTDFEWGRPRRSRIVHIDAANTISLVESRDEEGGVEVGWPFPMLPWAHSELCSSKA